MPGTGGQAGGSNPHLIWQQGGNQPTTYPCARSPTVCHSWHFQAHTHVRGPSSDPMALCLPPALFPVTLSSLSQSCTYTPPCAQTPDPQAGEAAGPAASWITFLKPQPFPETTCSLGLNLNSQEGERGRKAASHRLSLLSLRNLLHPSSSPSPAFSSITSSFTSPGRKNNSLVPPNPPPNSLRPFY